jgi:exopolysaccharide biosynthesis polyprenyl glycosylphosphotransferase
MLFPQRYRTIWKTALLPLVDFLAILVGTITVYQIRYNWFDDNFLGVRQLAFSEYFLIGCGVSLVVIIIYAFLGLYQIYQKRSTWQSVLLLSFGIFLVLLSIITFLFFNEYNRSTLPQGVPVSRFILGTGGFFALYFVLLGRLFIWAVEQLLYQFGLARIKIAIVGQKDGFLYNYFVDRSEVEEVLQVSSLDSETLAKLKSKMEAGDLHEIYLYGKNQDLEAELALWAERYNISFIFAPEGLGQFQSFGLKPIIIRKKLFLELQHSNLDGWQVILKRLFDILFALAFFAAFSWLYLIIIIAIKIDSPGPIFYRSERVGPDGKVFKLWKFRRLKKEFCTTEKNAEALAIEQELIKKQNMRDDVLYKIKDDPRSTRVGKFIEKYSLDELPQFINVLIGNMSVVGPRPHQPREVAKYQAHHYKVLNIKPGITGFAQINGRSDLSFEMEVYYDRYYIEHWTFWLDLWIVIKTPITILFKPHKG